MKIISFAKTTAALLAGHKSVTRRYWNPRHAASFKPGEIVQAWDKSPRFGGKKVAEIKILSIVKEDMKDAPDEDYAKEGFVFMATHGISLYKVAKKYWPPDGIVIPTLRYWEWWKNHLDENGENAPYVVRFEVTNIETQN